MSTRIIAWTQIVTQADPSFYYTRQHQLRDEFSSGRLFYSPVGNIYQAYLPVTSDDGTPITSNLFIQQYIETDSINPLDLWPQNQLVHGNGTP